MFQKQKHKTLWLFAVIFMLVAIVVPQVPVYAAEKSIPVKKITVDTKETIAKGTRKSFKVGLVPSNTTDTIKISAKSSDHRTLTASASKNAVIVKAKNQGSAIVTATIKVYSNKNILRKTYTKRIRITVKNATPLSRIAISKSNLTIHQGDAKTLRVKYYPSNTTAGKTVKWSSSNKKVAKVSKDGTVKAVSPGKATITAKVGKKTAKCVVNVDAPLQKIKLNKQELVMDVIDEDTLTATLIPKNTTDTKKISWTSSNTNVAVVDSKGLVKAKREGSVVITARAGAKKATCKITVKKDDNFENTTDCYLEMNKKRTENKLSVLSKSSSLERYAKIRAKEIAGKFSHERPNGERGLHIIPGNIYKGEILAKGYRTPKGVVVAWMKSPSHKEVITDKNFTKFGIACYISVSDGTKYWVTLFSS